MDDLARFERRLAEERNEVRRGEVPQFLARERESLATKLTFRAVPQNERLESRIMALKSEAEQAERKLKPQQRGAAVRQNAAQLGSSRAPAAPVAATPDAATVIQQLQAIQASLEAAQLSSSKGGDSFSTGARGRGALPSSSRSVMSASGRSTSASSVRRGTGGRSSVVPDTATSSVIFRSSLYRSVSPSKRVGPSGVVVSNFGRSSRFKDDKSEVPGPGKYDPHSTDFHPVAVSSGGLDEEGSLGHTHAAYDATVGRKPTPAQAHYDAMARATARVAPRTPDPERSALDALSPGTVGSSVSHSRGDGMSSLDAGVTALIDAHRGDVRAALAAAVRRERTTRKDLTLMRGNNNSARIQAGQQASVMMNEMEGLKSRLERKERALVSSSLRLKAWGDVFSRADQTMAQLTQWVGDAQAAAGRNPALSKAAETMRSLQAIVDSGAALAVGAAPGRGGAGDAGEGEGEEEGGYMAYSSLSAALVQPNGSSVGGMGQSETLVATQVAKQRSVAAAPPPPPARERSLTGAQSTGLGLAQTAAVGISAADVQARMPAPRFSAADVRAFARTTTADALASPTTTVSPSTSAAFGGAGRSSLSSWAAAPVEEGSVSSRLQALFAHYSAGPTAAGEGASATSFVQMLLDAGAVENGGSTLAHAEASFARAAAAARGQHPSTASASTVARDARLPYDAWVAALTDFSCRRFGIAPQGGDPTGLLVSPEAFRTLLEAGGLLALIARIRSGGAPRLEAGGRGASGSMPGAARSATGPSTTGFADAFLRPEVLSFFKDNKAGLQVRHSHSHGAHSSECPPTHHTLRPSAGPLCALRLLGRRGGRQA